MHLHGNSDFEAFKLGPNLSGSVTEVTLFITDLVGKPLRLSLLEALKYKKILIYYDTWKCVECFILLKFVPM